jgi:peptidoglycan/LPS O-acetylase OafA/YrhL
MNKVRLNPGTSWYLDLLRGVAAIVVLLGHAGQGFFSQGLPWMPKVAHEMVVIFFVLSGFVMSYVVSRGENQWQGYLLARFSRIASVAYPALLLTIICDFIGRRIAPDFYAEVARSGGYWGRILLSSLFLQQSGSLAASPGSTTPFRSLAYEVWYYIFLGLWLFVPGQRRRAILLLLGAVVAGPKILLLLPVWLFGVLAHKLSLRQEPWIGLSVFLFVVTTALLAAILSGHAIGLGYQGDWQARPPLYFSAGYLADYITGLLVAVHIFVVDQLMKYCRCQNIAKPVNCMTHYLADRSFSLYAFHMPLLYLAAVSLPYRKDDPLQVAAVLVLVLMIVLVLHWLTEKRRRVWQQAAQKALRSFQGLRFPVWVR